MARGDASIYSANISGFDITTLNLSSAGWARVAGTSDLVQSATKLIICQNGLVRVALDKNQSTGATAIQIAFFNGTTWVNTLQQDGTADWRSPTVTAVSYNNAKIVEVTFTSVDRNAVTLTHKLRINQAAPLIYLNKTTGTTTAARGLVALPTLHFKTAFVPVATNNVGFDKYGFAGSLSATVNDAFVSWPLPGSGFDLVTSCPNDVGVESTSSATTGLLIRPNDRQHFFIGFAPRTYALGDANAYYGNNDGQFRDAEGHRVWEGETPLVGTELLTNGQFETDLSGWTQEAGTWTRVTTQKKFGVASAEVTASGVSKALRRQLSGLTIGATYAVTGWFRGSSISGTGNIRLRVIPASQSGIVEQSVTNPAAAGGTYEWSYVAVQFVAVETNPWVDLFTDTAGGTIQFNGISVVQVADAAGVSTLAFDTRSTTGWTLSGATASVVDSPRGKAFRVTTTTQFQGARFIGSLQDLSRFRRIAFWARRISGSGNINVSIRNAANASATQALTVTATLTTDWQFFRTGDAQSSATSDGAVNNAVFHFESTSGSSNLVYEIGPITLSEFDISIGARHGLLDPLEDASLVLWFKEDEASGNLADSSGNGHVGTAAGSPTYSAATVRAGFGTCIERDGVDDTFSVADANSLDLATGLTLARWVFTDTVAAGQARIYSKDSAYYLRRNADAIELELTGLSDTSLSAAAALTASAWYHIVATYDGAMKRIYVNGALHTSEAATGSISVNTNALYIDSAAGTSEFWDGKLDEARIYNRALGPEEIAMRYNATVQQLAKWVPSASLKLEHSTDKKDGTYAIKATSSAADQFLTKTTVPMDLSAYTRFGIWTKQDVSDALFIRIGSDASNYRQWTINGSTTYAYGFFDFATPTSTTGTPDMTKVTHLLVGGIDSGTVAYIDSLKFMVGAETDDWRYAVDAGGSTGYVLKSLTTPVVNSIPRTWSMNFPAAGVWYVGVSAVAVGSGGLVDALVDGVASGTPQAVSTTALSSQTTHLMFGPFTIATAGNKDVQMKCTTVGSMTSLAVDFVDLFAHSATASSPATFIGPRDLGRAALRTVTPA